MPDLLSSVTPDVIVDPAGSRAPKSSGIIISTVRVLNFRCLKAIEVPLGTTTIMIGENNVGKTSFLDALHGAIGSGQRRFSEEDPWVTYLAKHPTRLNYASRLACGRSIGSGLVEGTIKQEVNLRLKRTGARWRAEHVGPLVELRALSHTPDWQNLWTAA